ncbi:MAG: signal peptidase I [Wujia sp.]
MSRRNKDIFEDDKDLEHEETEEMATEEPESEEADEIDKLIAKEKKKEERREAKKAKKKAKADQNKRKPEDVNIVKELLSLIIYIGLVVLLCYAVIRFVGCRSRVAGSSMNPTLENNDNLWVDKLSYTFGDPKRFDIIIFNYNETTTYVKRIIGLPGETVRIDQNGNIYINEQLLVEDYGSETILPNNLGRASQPVLLGEDEYFVLGDNRNNSSDSRWPDVGNVNRDDIVGKVVLRIYPFSSFGTIK